jgi:hypothetical protein
VLDDDGNILEDLFSSSEFTRVITGTEELFGREYVLEEESGVQRSPLGGGPTTWTYWYRYRQDGSGLYEADVSLVDPPGVHPVTGRVHGGLKPGITLTLGRVPEGHRGAFQAALQRLEARRARLRAALGLAARGSGGALDHELTRLRYPLHPGTAWEIRVDPDLVIHARVERHEVLELPAGRFPAWRIRIRWELGDPDDTILVWYGSSGYLQSFVHIRSEATDADGTPIGVVVSDETDVLTSLQLAGPPVRRGPRTDVAL